MMVAVALVAVNLSLIQMAEDLTADNCMVSALLPAALVLVPSLSLLTVAAVSAGLGLVKRGHSPPFSTGYLLLGGLVSFGVCLDMATQTFWLLTVTVREPDPLQAPSHFEELCSTVLMVAMSALPQIALALIGGGLAVRYGLTIVLRGRAGATSDA
jgi:hypothetical protein